MRSIMVYRNAGKLQVVIEQVCRGQRAYLYREPIAELPPGYSDTARMLGQAVSTVYGIRVAWLPKSCARCLDFGYQKENGQQVCRFGDNFCYQTNSYDADYAQRCKNYRE